MRQVETLMREAAFKGEPFKMSNTTVERVTPHCVSVYLHGNEIAIINVNNGALLVNTDTLKEYPSNTTISRLRALGANLTVSKGDVYLDDKFICNRKNRGF